MAFKLVMTVDLRMPYMVMCFDDLDLDARSQSVGKSKQINVELSL